MDIAASLALTTSLLAGLTIFLGGIVEGYGYGLSLGTKWPYTRDIHRIAIRGDPEAVHRITATLTGVLSLGVLALKPNSLSVFGFVAVGLTALLGMATLYVLAGRLPSFLQGFHDITAYTTFLLYFLIFEGYMGNLSHFFSNPLLLEFYVVIFLGGTVSGTRRMSKSIGYFLIPTNRQQLTWSLHGLAVLSLVISSLFLGNYFAFVVTLLDAAVGGFLFTRINERPGKPGILVGVHQVLTLVTIIAIAFPMISIANPIVP